MAFERVRQAGGGQIEALQLLPGSAFCLGEGGRNGGQGNGESEGPGFEQLNSPEVLALSGERCNERKKPDTNEKNF